MKLALLMLCLSTDPTVHVDAVDHVSADSALLRGWVAARLVQERYTVVPTAEAAQWTIRVEHAADGWRLEVRGQDVLHETIAPAEDGIARLELLHRTIEALERVQPATLASEASALRLRLSLDPSSDSSALESRIASATLERGLALAGIDATADASLCVSRIEGVTVRVAIGQADESCDGPLASASTVALDALPAQLPELLSISRPSNADDDSPEPETLDEDLPALDAEVSNALAGRQPSPSRPRRGRWSEPARVLRVGVSGGLVSRLRPVDGAVGIHARFGREPGLGVRADLEVWPSVHDALRVVEVAPSVGLEGRLVSTELLAFDVGALLGPLVHEYSIQGGARGRRIDWNVSVPLSLSFRIAAGLEGSIGFRLGRSGRARSHVIDGEGAWARGAWRLGAMLGLAYQWRLR